MQSGWVDGGFCPLTPPSKIVFITVCTARAKTWEHQVNLDYERYFPLSFSFICGITILDCKLFIVPMTATFCPLRIMTSLPNLSVCIPYRLTNNTNLAYSNLHLHPMPYNKPALRPCQLLTNTTTNKLRASGLTHVF